MWRRNKGDIINVDKVFYENSGKATSFILMKSQDHKIVLVGRDVEDHQVQPLT